MSDARGRVEEAKGRAKEAAGALADDDQLRKEGKTEGLAGRVKRGIERAKDAGEDAVDRVRDEAKDAFGRT